VKSPKVRGSKPSSTMKGRNHPTFKVMITKALGALHGHSIVDEDEGRECWGSLVYIKKYLETNYKVDPKNKWITRTIASMLKDGTLRCPEGKKVYSLTIYKLSEPSSEKKGYYSSEYSSTESDEEVEHQDSDDESYDDNPKKEGSDPQGFVADTYGGGKVYVPFHTLYPKITQTVELHEEKNVRPSDICKLMGLGLASGDLEGTPKEENTPKTLIYNEGGQSVAWFTELSMNATEGSVSILKHYRLHWDEYVDWPEKCKKEPKHSQYYGSDIWRENNEGPIKRIATHYFVPDVNKWMPISNPKYIFDY
jgi:hypothetical protein